MKKSISIVIVLIFILTVFVSCKPVSKNPTEDVVIRIGYLAGPTGMGMAKMIIDNNGLDGGNDRYTFTKYADTQAAKADLTAGKIDIICLPTNEAAVYHKQSENNAMVLAINCLNSLYLLTAGTDKVNSLSDLEGHTVFTCKNGTPRIVLEHIINQLGINVTVSYEHDGKVILTPQDLSALVVSGALPNAVMPEPLVTSSLLSITKNGNEAISYTVDVNLANEWEKFCGTPITMGCILANGDFVTAHRNSINTFLEEYKSSVEYIGNPQNIDSAANYIVDTAVMGAVSAAKKSLSNLGNAICYIDGKEMKTTLIAFYNAIGIALPDDNFYYEK